MEDTEEIIEYMWLKPNLTSIDVDIFVDDGGAYLRHNHELLLFARNGYGRGSADFMKTCCEKIHRFSRGMIAAK